ncbi:hypothetical protein WJX72_004863 [[Myrmecia] bisecta]|uniref:Uncharacterized protein n=1 Tax=[Myrmecia] bisecta TaxID=41462 RepID=A0AAW1P4T2_9CHLO
MLMHTTVYAGAAQLLLAILCWQAWANQASGAEQSSETPACPGDPRTAPHVYPGCPCTPAEQPATGACPAGWQCSLLWPGAQRSAAQHVVAGQENATCVPCAFGQYCPEGTFQPSDEEELQQYVRRTFCRAGHYCPSPSEMYPCPSGSFCPSGSVTPTTCEYQQLMAVDPGTIIPAPQENVFERVHFEGDPLAGNFCPSESSTPQNACKQGYFCPNATTSILCPAGKFCKTWSRSPKDCPFLAMCPVGSGSADLSLGGFFAGMIILCTLWLAYLALNAYIRLQQEEDLRKQAAQEKLHRLVAPLLALHGPGNLSYKAFGTIRPKLNVRFENMGVRLRDGTVILDGVTGSFGHSKVVGILGTSGAGKTTFIHALMGRASFGVTTGDVWVNERNIPLSRLRRILGFVPQDDIVHEDLTVRENLAYSAWLRSPAYMRRKEKGDIVEDVLDVLSLRHVQHSVVGSVEKRGISGGQRKRVNIGLELVSKPSLMLMDEPTSGLDATAATDILTALKRMADLGMNIVTVIHQPRYSIFTLFHEVLLLGMAGRTVFLGPSRAALPYFQSLGFVLPPNENPADFCLDVISGCVPCRTDPDFKPEDLYAIWEDRGAEWRHADWPEEASTSQSAAGDDLEPDADPDQANRQARRQGLPMQQQQQRDQRQGAPSLLLMQQNQQQDQRQGAAAAVGDQEEGMQLSPEQLQLICEHFDKVDQDGTGCLTRDAVGVFLTQLGLQPSLFDVKHVMAELGASRSGTVSREAFIEFIRLGGRRPPDRRPGHQRQTSIELDADDGPLGPSGLALGSLGSLSQSPGPSAAQPQRDEWPQHRSGSGYGARPSDGQRRPPMLRSPFAAAAGQELPGFRPIHIRTTGLDSSSHGYPPGHSPMSITNTEFEACLSTSLLQQYGSGEAEVTSGEKPLGCGAACLHKLRAAGRWLCSARKKASRYRSIPGTRQQYVLLLRRAGLKWVRGWGYKFTDLLMFVGAALVVGASHGTAWTLERVRGNSVMAMMTLGVIAAASSLQVFGKDRLVFWRESASGLRTPAYFFSAITLHMIDVLAQPAIFMSLYYTLTLPEIAFVDYYTVSLLVVWYTTGLGYLLSVVMAPQNSMVAVVAVTLVFGGFLNGVEPKYRSLTQLMKHVFGISYGKFAVESIMVQEFQRYPHYMQPRVHIIMDDVGFCGLDAKENGAGSFDTREICKGYVAWDYMALILQGFVLRLMTYIALCCCNSTATRRGNGLMGRLPSGFWHTGEAEEPGELPSSSGCSIHAPLLGDNS